ncbi:MAG: flagellar M-ring protein FliF [Oscillospiraceae bacterium]|nr:flagellar M-ring protein FliF [Oscillospiraceae bacterium]
MPAILQKHVEQAKDFWRNLDRSQKNRIYITSGMVVVAVCLLIFIITRPNRMTLVSTQDRAQVGEMAQILDDSGIWNRVENGGTSILIDTKNNDRSQVLLAQEGYPKDGLAFEDAISMIGLTTTDNEKKRIWKAQTTSDIEKKIKMLDNIENATVQLAIPEPRIFLTDSQQPQRPTSTVTIWPKEGNTLLPTQIDGIKQIVMGSVEDMDYENIMVIDNMGYPLDGSSDVDPMSLIPNQEELRQRYTKDIENKIFRLYGLSKNDFFDSLSVVASPFLDFAPLDYTNENIYTPDGFDAGEGALLERHLRREDATNYTTGGVPAMDTNPGENIPIYPMQGNTGTGEYNMLDDQTAYGYNKRVEVGAKALGEFVPAKSNLSIVLKYGLDVESDANLTEEFMDGVQLAASNATSIPPENISVTKMRLAKPVTPIVPITERIQQVIADYGILILLLFLILTLILSLFMRGKRKEEEEVEDLQLQIAEGIIEPEEGRQFQDVDFDEKSEIREQLEKLIQQKPEAVASLLRNWLAEEWE